MIWGKYQDYVPDEFLSPKRTQLIIKRDKIIKWVKWYPYIPVNLIQLPPEIIYMIARLASTEFVYVSKEYYNEILDVARLTWRTRRDERVRERKRRIYKDILGADSLPDILIQTQTRCRCQSCEPINNNNNLIPLFIPLSFWLHNTRVDTSMPMWIDPTSTLRYAT
jgi:hypothetical protein